MAGISFLAPSSVSVNLNGVPSIIVTISSGARGVPGVGLPTGGSTGQILVKRSGSDFQTEWADAPSGTGGGARWGALTGLITDQADLKAIIDGLNAALALKETLIAAGQANQYLTGIKTWADLNKAAVGLANVDNTADAAKPVSTAVSAALALKLDAAKVSTTALTFLDDATIADMRATLGLGSAATSAASAFAAALHTHAIADIVGLAAALAGKAPTAHTHTIADVTGLQPALDAKAPASALTLLATKDELADGLADKQEKGDYASLVNGKVPLDQLPPISGGGGSAGVFSVNGREGYVTLDKADVGLDQAENTSDADKPISTATQDALNLKANLTDIPTPVDLAPYATKSDLNGKANTAHTHTITEVTGLRAELDGKQAAGSYQPAGDYASTSAVAAKLDASAYVRGVSAYCSGKPSGGEVVAGSIAPYAFTATAASSSAKSTVAAAANATFTIRKGSTVVGTFVFAAGATTATVSITSGVIAVGDLVTITAPATADGALANIAFVVR